MKMGSLTTGVLFLQATRQIPQIATYVASGWQNGKEKGCIAHKYMLISEMSAFFNLN